ncbi:MAG: 5,10-methylene tetrahydromethanopterin reductase [Deltaproteobacteria bacterium]|nr:5,10-methylene tetrahydromethanopterin reductase [Deltaproteobacteria bacterium]
MQIGCAFAAGFEAPRQAQVAESLGYDFIGFYDSPALGTDIWLTLAEALRATERITVGSYVLIPSLRHPMAQASAIATLCHSAPGRLEIGMGTGFTGRRAIGQRPLSWAFMRQFIEQLRGLLEGGEVEIDGAIGRMIHPRGYAPERPIEIPLMVAANGPKGIRVARNLADGLIYGGPEEDAPSGFDRLELALSGIPLEEGEDAASPRVIEAARIWFTLRYHLAYDGFSSASVESLPHGDAWLEMIERTPEATRHLKVHDRHLVEVNEHDHEFSERYRDELEAFARTAAIPPSELSDRVERLTALGATRAMTWTIRPDWERGLRSFQPVLGD